VSEAQWDFVYACYANTYAVRRQTPYLTRDFFSLLAERMPESIRVVLAKQGSIPVTNTSVNPARSTGPALSVGGWALQQLWMFWLAPMVGAAIGAVVYRWLGKEGS